MMQNETKDYTGLICKAALLLVVFIFLVIYLPHGEWYDKRSSDGSYSAGTYLDGGKGKLEYNVNQRIYYEYQIKSGGICLDLLDEDGNVVYRIGAVQSCSGYITIGEDVAPGTYYFHEYAMNADTVADSHIVWQKKQTNLERILFHFSIIHRSSW